MRTLRCVHDAAHAVAREAAHAAPLAAQMSQWLRVIGQAHIGGGKPSDMRMPKRSSNPGPSDTTARAPLVLARRKCTVCEWAAEVVEPIDANPDCPWCHGPTERLSTAVLDAAPPPAKGTKNPAAAALRWLGGSKGGRRGRRN